MTLEQAFVGIDKERKRIVYDGAKLKELREQHQNEPFPSQVDLELMKIWGLYSPLSQVRYYPHKDAEPSMYYHEEKARVVSKENPHMIYVWDHSQLFFSHRTSQGQYLDNGILAEYWGEFFNAHIPKAIYYFKDREPSHNRKIVDIDLSSMDLGRQHKEINRLVNHLKGHREENVDSRVGLVYSSDESRAIDFPMGTPDDIYVTNSFDLDLMLEMQEFFKKKGLTDTEISLQCYRGYPTSVANINEEHNWGVRLM